MEGRVCEEFTPRYYGLCAIGGMVSAGTTHLAITPFDVLKVNMQVNFQSCINCFIVPYTLVYFVSLDDKKCGRGKLGV